MKRYRVGYYLSMIFLLLAGLGTGIWLFYFLLTILMLLLLAALVLNLWTYFSFSCKQKLSQTSIVKDGSCTLKVSVCSNKPFPFIQMCATVETLSPDNPARLTINLAPNNTSDYDIPISCPHRGMYEVGLTIIEVTDIFGILSMRFDLRLLPHYQMQHLIVYPRLLQTSAPPTGISDGAKQEGIGVQRLTEDGESFSDTRQYRFGDPLKRVHKIISARKRELYVKRYDIPEETTAILAIDTRKNGLAGEDRLNYNDIACECAAAVTHYLLRSGYAARLIGAEASEPAVEGKSIHDFQKLYDHLAVMQFDTDADIAAQLSDEIGKAPNPRMVYVISSRNDKALIEALAMLAQSADYVKLIVPVLSDGAESISIPGVSVSSVASAADISFKQ